MSMLVTKSVPFTGTRPMKMTVAKFHALREANHLEGERTFLLRGTVMEQGPMNPPHALTCEIINNLLPDLFTLERWRIRCHFH